MHSHGPHTCLSLVPAAGLVGVRACAPAGVGAGQPAWHGAH